MTRTGRDRSTPGRGDGPLRKSKQGLTDGASTDAPPGAAGSPEHEQAVQKLQAAMDARRLQREAWQRRMEAVERAEAEASKSPPRAFQWLWDDGYALDAIVRSPRGFREFEDRADAAMQAIDNTDPEHQQQQERKRQRRRRWIEQQADAGVWVSVESIASWYACAGGRLPNDADLHRKRKVFELILADIAACRTRAAFISEQAAYRFTPEKLQAIEEIFGKETDITYYAQHLWLRRRAAEAWFTRHHLEKFESLLAPPRTAPPPDAPPPSAAPPTPADPPVPKRRHNGLDYRASDAPLVIEMDDKIKAGKARSAEAAAREVVDRADGGGTAESKVKRLAKHHRKTFPPKP